MNDPALELKALHVAMHRSRDPLRPLRIAVRLIYILAAVFVALGVWSGYTYPPLRSVPTWARIVIVGTLSLASIAPGAAYVLFAIYLKRQRYWALVAALVLSATQLLEFLRYSASLLYYAMAGVTQPRIWIAAGIYGLAIGLILTLFYYLLQSLPVIRESTNALQGFEPLVPEAKVVEQPATSAAPD